MDIFFQIKRFGLIPDHQHGIRCKSNIPDFERGRRGAIDGNSPEANK